jgi:hypothetical protein
MIFIQENKSFLLTFGATSYFVHSDTGVLDNANTISWKYGTPIRIVVSRPYILAIMKDFRNIEIKSALKPN